MLTFAIPTWNRSGKLATCVTSIAEQVIENNIQTRLLISDNASDDDTPQVVAALQGKYPFIEYTRMAEHGFYPDNFRHMCGFIGGDYCWMLGDDDIMMPGALKLALTYLDAQKPAFLHCADRIRVTGNNRVVAGTMLDLCNRFGWLEIAGFLPTCVVRSDVLRKVPDMTTLPLYKENSFTHSCVLLELLADKPALVLDVPMVTPQDSEQAADSLARWAAENVSYRYFMVGDALQSMVDSKIIPPKLSATFFRYHRFYLWDRFIGNLLHEVYNRPRRLTDDAWRRIDQLAGFLEDKELAKLVRLAVTSAKKTAISFVETKEAMAKIDTELRDLYYAQCQEVLTYPTLCDNAAS